MAAFNISDLMALMRDRDGYEPGVWPPKAWEPILCEIGRIVFNWNTAERSMTSLLNALMGGEHRAIIATAHMGNRSKMYALRTLANEFLDGDEKGSVLHAATLFDRLLERRNHYVHSFSNIAGGILGGEYVGKLGSYQARGRLIRKEQTITAPDLADEAKLLHAANHYFALVHNHFRYPNNPEYTALPEEFPLPDRLNLPLRFVLGDQPRPQSSEA